MKTLLKLIVFILFLLYMEGIQARHRYNGTATPFKPQSPLFGKDIVILDSLNLDQGEVAICSAFNGWLYALVTYYDSINGFPGAYILQSIDTGITWNNLYGGDLGFAYLKLRSNSIVVLGDSVSNIKIFTSGICSSGSSDLGYGFVDRFNGVTGDLEAQIFVYASGLASIALATDYNYQATSSSHPTLGMVCSTPTQVAYHSSSNGGMSFDFTSVIATTSNSYYHKVALNYGRSPSYSSGRYFATWEEQQNQSSTLGHIYTAHSEPNFNSPFTHPVCIDSLDSSGINKMKNPVIACQFSGSDNDSSNITEVIMAEKELTTNNYDTRGFYNLQAATSNHFNEFTLIYSTNKKTQADINFNPYNSTFMLTYYDSTLRSLPFLTNDVNMGNPDTWNIITNAYNDNGNIYSPLPKVRINYLQQTGMNAWTAERTNGHGIALFDAPYSTYTGMPEINLEPTTCLIGAYPNPCSNYIKITFDLKKAMKVTINIFSLMGQPLGTITDQNYSEGKHIVQFNVSDFPEGTYLYNFNADNLTTSGKFIKVK